MDPSLTTLIQHEVIPLVRAALTETAELTGAVQVLSQRVDELTAELAEGELREVRRLLGRRDPEPTHVESVHVGGAS